ncbi:phosphotransferase [Asanoa hainanensis]|uniref:phosphotransferase n=1 Tax=Asanoa hainanensis TaxID=560556 RepID=UPI0015C5E6C2|nr:phosphotransferase [Asanoa hainanensis]
MDGEAVARRFGLGRPVAPAVRVEGGLSNELWRLTTADRIFAVKRMVINADRPDFVDNVEAAYAVERRAWAAGVPMPEPIPVPDTGRALAEVGQSLYRVHRWVDGEPGRATANEAATLLADIHAVGERRPGTAEPGWTADRYGADLVELTRRVESGPTLIVDSHCDLDRKNTLRSADGTLFALDWDAAGPTGAVQEAAGLALDWAGGDKAVFAGALRAYSVRSGLTIPNEPWIFAGWVAAQGGWLDYHATRPEPESRDQVRRTLAQLRALAASLDDLLGAR